MYCHLLMFLYFVYFLFEFLTEMQCVVMAFLLVNLSKEQMRCCKSPIDKRDRFGRHFDLDTRALCP